MRKTISIGVMSAVLITGAAWLSACQVSAPGESLQSGGGKITGGTDIYAQVGQGDWKKLWNARQKALETSVSGKSVSWSNPKTGMGGLAVPVKTWKTAEGVYCRSYNEKIWNSNGQRQSRTATACRDRDKIWKRA